MDLTLCIWITDVFFRNSNMISLIPVGFSAIIAILQLCYASFDYSRTDIRSRSLFQSLSLIAYKCYFMHHENLEKL